MKTRNLADIEINKKAWKKTNKNKKLKPVVGLDTETENGLCFIIGIHDKSNKGVMRIRHFEDFIYFCQFYRLQNKHNFFYNLTYDMNAIIKHLPEQNIIELADTDETRYRGVFIKIIPDKHLLIEYNKKKYNFYDLAQFYNRLRLTVAGEKELGSKKEELEEIDITKLSPKRYDNDLIYREKINKYLYKDCELCYLLAKELIIKAKPFLLPKYFYSQASLSQQYFLENCNRDYSLPKLEILQYALNAYNGGRFEVFKRGTFKNVSCYDIRSAYPYHNSKIPAMDKGKWVKNKRYDKNALLSLFHGVVEGNSIISPIRHEEKNMLYYPVGKKEMYFNKSEYEIFKLYGYKVKIIDVWHYYDKKPEYPFKFLEKFYYEKEKIGKEHSSYMFYKIIINGFYGKTIQLEKEYIPTKEFTNNVKLVNENGKAVFMKEVYKAGLIFNPIIAQEITANTRCQLLKAVHKIQDKVIAFATDSIIIHDAKPNIKIGKELGMWDTEEKNKKFTSIGSGVYFFENELMKFRGFGRGINPESVFTEDNQQIIQFQQKRNIKLKQFLRQKDIQKEHFNLIVDITRELDLNFDKKREWERPIKNVKDLMQNQIGSKPKRI